MSLADRMAQSIRAKTDPQRQSDRLLRAGEVVADEVRRRLATPGTEESHARPGEAPRRQSGTLLRSVGVRPVPGGVAVVMADYGRFLEARHPFLAPSVEATRDRVRRILLEGE